MGNPSATLAADSVFLDLVEKRAMADFEELRCVGSIAASGAQCNLNQVDLDDSPRAPQAEIVSVAGLRGLAGTNDIFRKVAQAESVSVGKDHCTLDHILQFTDISRPTVGDESVEGFIRDSVERLSQDFHVMGEIMIDQ